MTVQVETVCSSHVWSLEGQEFAASMGTHKISSVLALAPQEEMQQQTNRSDRLYSPGNTPPRAPGTLRRELEHGAERAKGAPCSLVRRAFRRCR